MWDERDTCWVSNIEQGTEEWKKLRLCSISSSNISECVGRSSFSPKNHDEKIELAKIICGISQKSFSEEAISNMKRGTLFESNVREYHFNKIRSKEYNLNMKELGLAVWKNDQRFRGSVDAEIGEDGIAEYKVPKYMYKKLIQYVEANEKGYKCENDMSHIFNSHLDQMTQNSIILNKKWCDYQVVSFEDKLEFYQRIPTNYDLWNDTLYPLACEYYTNYIDPIINEYHLKLVSPN